MKDIPWKMMNANFAISQIAANAVLALDSTPSVPNAKAATPSQPTRNRANLAKISIPKSSSSAAKLVPLPQLAIHAIADTGLEIPSRTTQKTTASHA
jgi:hypothetical protein